MLKRKRISLALALGFYAMPVVSCTSRPTEPASALATCTGCHGIEQGGKGGTGPNLYDVIGRRAGQAAGFSYSPALRDSGIVWSAATLDRYLADPMTMVPGTRMNVRMRDPAERQAIIKQLQAK